MIYNLPYQSEELLRNSYLKLRKFINPQHDKIYLTVIQNQLQNISNEEIYKKILKLEGIYRSENNLWTSEMVKIRIVSQL